MASLADWIKSQTSDYGQLFNNNPRMDATKQFGGRAINNINSAGEGYSQWQRLQDQNFGPNQSVIASGFMHPQKGLSKLADWFTNNVNTAAGLPDPNQQDEASMYAYGPNIDQQAESGLNLAGLLQTGAFASGAAPKSAGGTLGTFTGPKSMGWNHDAANTATKLLDNGADPAQVWKDHLIGRMPDGKLFSEIDDSLAKISDIKKGFSNKNIEDVISHPELMNNYNLTTKIDHIPKEYSFHPEQNKITIGSIPLESGDPDLLLHELQHAIQSKEGWPQGGNPEMLHKEYIQGIKYGDKEATKKLYGKLLSWDDAYNRLTGEAQARATQDRMNMNMQQRRDNYPLAGDKLSDIPLDQLINMYGDNGPSMSMNIKNGQYNKEKKMKEMR